MEKTRPTIGVALSGAAIRAVAQIGVLEVFRENGIPVDYIVGCSSGALVAASFCAGSMEQLKQDVFRHDLKTWWSFFSLRDANGGWFHLDSAAREFGKYIRGLRFEDSNPKLGLTVTDINTGELITLRSGDVLEGLKATVALPGWFEPVVKENKILVDGGLADIIPVSSVKQMGADIVIGVDGASSRYLYRNRVSFAIWRKFRELFGFPKNLEPLDPNKLNSFKVLTRAWDLSLQMQNKTDSEKYDCDFMLDLPTKHYRRMDFKNLRDIYKEGRKAAEKNLPALKELIHEFAKH
ncbi:MAG: patatin-like phospholipase family protein [Candidatus Doudnabacteria bacterium]|nr:patatin-like phospholipase family protein [Candidatus Doudnabacteria bacterium]